MSVMDVLTTETEVAAVAFVPLRERPAPGPQERIRLPAMPLADRLLQALRQPLVDLARSARRLGPRDAAAVLLLTGCRPRVGCSTVAAALAGAAAEERPVLLIDADLQEAGLSRLLGEPADTGWQQIMEGLGCVETVLQHPDPSRRLSFLPLQPSGAAAGEWVMKPLLRPWLNELRREYGLIVVDGGLLEGSGAVWAPLADATLLVCDAASTTGYDWPAARARLEAAGTPILGIVETFGDKTVSSA